MFEEEDSINNEAIGDKDGLSYIPLLSNYDNEPPKSTSPPKEIINNNNNNNNPKFPIQSKDDKSITMYNKYKTLKNGINNNNLTNNRSIIYQNTEEKKSFSIVPKLNLNNMKSDNNNNNNNNNNIQKKSMNQKINSPNRDITILTANQDDKMFHQFLYSNTLDKDTDIFNKSLNVPELCIVGNFTDRNVYNYNQYHNTSINGSKSARIPLKKKKINNGYEVKYLNPNLNGQSQFNASLYDDSVDSLQESSQYSLFTQITSKGNTINIENKNINEKNKNKNKNNYLLTSQVSSHHFGQPLSSRKLLPSEKILKRNYNKKNINKNNITKEKVIYNIEIEELIDQLKLSANIEFKISEDREVNSANKTLVAVIPNPYPPNNFKGSSNSPRKDYNKISFTHENNINEIDRELDYVDMLSIPLTDSLNESENCINLTKYEKSEILDYKNIYYVGVIDNKVNTNSSLQNYGFDDLNGYYNGGDKDHIGYRYEILNIIGQGSFGNVFKCRDHKTGVDVAIKIIRNQRRFVNQAEIELKVLNLLALKNNKIPINENKENDNTINKHNHNFVQLLSSFDFRKHKCFVFPLHDINMYEYLKLNNFQGCSSRFVRKVAIQLLECLVHLESIGVIHCDIKPENILLRNENASSIVLIDFGSSCMVGHTLYSYIQSRFYRAPEVILGVAYSHEIDMWGFASLLPEIRTGHPSFPGENEIDQLACIAEVLGNPPLNMIELCNRKDKLFSEENQLIINNTTKGYARVISSKTFENLINARSKDKKFVSFLKATLHWDPKLRLTPSNALKHPYITDEIISNKNKNAHDRVLPKSKQGIITDDKFSDDINDDI